MLALEIALILVLTVLNGVLSMSEIAVISARRARLQALENAGHKGAATALGLASEPGRFLSTVQIGITLVGVLTGAFGGATLAERLGGWLDGFAALAPHGETIGFVLVVVAITYLSLVIGELVPKRLGLAAPERIAAAVARPMRMLSRLAAPAVGLLQVSTELVFRALGMPERSGDQVTEEEVRSLVAEGTLAGVFEPQERELIEGVLRLDDWRVKSVMTPRSEVVWVDVDASAEEILREMQEIRVSRLVVCEGDIDQVIGTVHTKDLLMQVLSGEPISLRQRLSAPFVIPESMTVLQLLDRFKRSGNHFAIILDEYGTTEGIVTLNDILEAIAGQLPESGEPSEPFFREREDGSWLVEGHTPIGAFAAKFGLDRLIEEPSFHTAAGLLLDRLGHIPASGDSVALGAWRIEVVDMDGRRVDKLLVSPLESGPSEATGGEIA